MAGQNYAREEKVPAIKLSAVQYAVLAMFIVLLFGFWRLQIVHNDTYSSLAERNRIRTIPILAPRGKILDRNGVIIVDNYPSFSALLLREQGKELEEKIPRIAAGLHIPELEIRDRLRHFSARPKYEPIVIKQDITPDDLAFIESNKNELPELETIMVHRRLYPRDGFAAHLIGYVGEVSEDDLNRSQYELYKQGDIVGKSGVEQTYNDILIGVDGERRAIVDNRGKEVGRLSKTNAEPGKPLKLTIDVDLQIAAEEAMGDKVGGLVAMDPRNGEILAMVSRPIFDPNHFAVRITRDEWSHLVNDPSHPLMNKAIQAQLAPGSIFKIIMSVAGEEEGITQNMNVNCGGGGTFYGRYFKCWIAAKHSSHGAVNLHKAIEQSCDVFFYTLGERLGIGKIAQYAQKFGLGQKTGIDLPQEVSGIMPSEEWKIRNYKQKWYAGETISVSIGQGAVTTTPIQLARAIGAIASGGKLVRPHVAFPEEMPPQLKLAQQKMTDPEPIKIDPSNWEAITDAMADVTNPGGTAAASHLPGIDFAGKTGSAQVISNDLMAKLGGKSKAGNQFKDNGWFVGVTPRRNPEIVIAALIEQGEHGTVAAEVVSKVIKAYVENKRKAGFKDTGMPPLKATAGLQKNYNVEVAAIWSQMNSSSDASQSHEELKAGRFKVTIPAKSKQKPKHKSSYPSLPAVPRMTTAILKAEGEE